MEQSGRNRRQLVANRAAPVTAQTSHFTTASNHGNGPRPHGKEEVDDSSPSEAFQKPRKSGLLVRIDLHVARLLSRARLEDDRRRQPLVLMKAGARCCARLRW